jgi:hypothetical protein
MRPQYSYRDALASAEKVNWRVEDLIGGGKSLDFDRPFLPEKLAQVRQLDFLTAKEQRVLNQVRGHTYLAMFGIVEEFILPFVLDHARPQVNGEDYQVRALLEFAAEEAKHIHLFRRFREEFARGFGTKCEVIGPASEIGRAVLAHEPLSVALAILMIEWMTQRHYLDSVKDDQDLDPQFQSLLKHHWMEEAQHAKLDALMVEALAAGITDEQADRAVDGFLEIGGMLDAGLGQQVLNELQAFQDATGRTLNDAETNSYTEAARKAARWTYLGSGLTHPNFIATLGALGPRAQERIAAIAPAFC